MGIPIPVLITTATRTKRFSSESALVRFVQGLSTDSAVNIAITQTATVSLVEKDTISFGIPMEGDTYHLTIAGVTFDYLVVLNDTELIVANAFKALIDAEIAGNPGGAVDLLIASPSISSLNLVGKIVNTPLNITYTIDIVEKASDFVFFIPFPTRNTAVGTTFAECWSLFYHLNI